MHPFKLSLSQLLLIFVTIASCAKPQPAGKQALPSELKTKKELYLKLVEEVQDRNGFIDYAACDSLLFSSLLGVAGGQVNISAAEKEPGRWLRRPIYYKECFSSRESQSTISRDQLLGLMYYSYVHKRLDIVENLWEYGERRNWVMGDDDVLGAHTVLIPEYITILAEVIFALGGDNHRFWRALPILHQLCEGFTCHLSALKIALLSDIRKGISASDLETLQGIVERNPKNPLFQALYHKYTDGDQSIAIQLLSNELIYPINHLPTNLNTCESWPTQRSDTDIGLQPCSKAATHSGGDFLFVIYIMEQE